jgi:integrase
MAGKRRGRHPEKALTALKVRSIKKPGRYSDGGGLHLLVKPSGAKSWVLRLVVKGRRRDIGLGGTDAVPLTDARELARQYRETAKRGGDPVAEKRKAALTALTFEEAARVVRAGHAGAWRNAKYGSQWLTTLETHVFPTIGKRRVDQIEVADVLKVLAPIWLTKPETARRVRQRIRTVLDWARAAGHRSIENPIGPVLAKALPRQPKRDGHHAALPYPEVPGFLTVLRENPASEAARLAFELLILTATRTGEVLGARPAEFHLVDKLWIIPPERMKAGREFRVPLSKPAVEVLRRALELSSGSEFVFQGARPGRPLSGMVFLMLLRRMGMSAITVHGFRSSFRDWISETTGFPAEVAEMALAHSIADKTEAAYRRGDLFEKRRQLMEAWAGFATGSVGKVVPMRKATVVSRGRRNGRL